MIHRTSVSIPAGNPQNHVGLPCCLRANANAGSNERACQYRVSNRIPAGSRRKPPRKPGLVVSGGEKADVLRTVMRDLHGVRTSLLDRESRRVTLEKVDTLMDELENYMAEN